MGVAESVYIDSSGQERRKMPVKIGRRADGEVIWGDGQKIWAECLPGGCRGGRGVWHTPGSWHRREPCTPEGEGEPVSPGLVCEAHRAGGPNSNY